MTEDKLKRLAKETRRRDRLEAAVALAVYASMLSLISLLILGVVAVAGLVF